MDFAEQSSDLLFDLALGDIKNRLLANLSLPGCWVHHPIRRFSAESFPRLFTTSKLTLAPSASEV